MASHDYLHCGSGDLNCKGQKLIYVGDRFWASEPPKVYCNYCYQKLVKKIKKMEKRK